MAICGPMVTSIWSTPRTSWLTIASGSIRYIKKIIRGDNSNGGGVREEKISGGFKWTRSPTVLNSDVRRYRGTKKRGFSGSTWRVRSCLVSRDLNGRIVTGAVSKGIIQIGIVTDKTAEWINIIVKLGPIICTLNPTLSIKEELMVVAYWIECRLGVLFTPEVADVFYWHIMAGKGRPDSRKAAEALHYSIKRLREKEGITLTSWIPFVHLGI
ncbi:hypothetical protein CPB86DRAFT_802335 [Serendipita vermifera]|nr:hypothetical protein CPB86DRAFT_802335 [Serendipita vermifera]